MADNLSDVKIDFIITKASEDPETGEKRWRATVSKFEKDKQDDEVTKEFYEYAAHQIAEGVYPSPALVVSHFDDPRPESKYTATPDIFVAGHTTDIYVDGNLPKAKGVFADTPLGNALFNAVKIDQQLELPHEERIRISMAFRPEPGGLQKSDAGHNVFTKGSIRHYAATRVPIVGSTNIEVGGLELKSDIKLTKKQDAESIVGEEFAEELYGAYSEIMKSKSDDQDLFFKADDGFDMGACLETKKSEDIPEKQALAICLSMQRRAGEGVPPKDKSEALDMEDIVYMAEYLDYLEKAKGNPFRDRLGRFSTRGSAIRQLFVPRGEKEKVIKDGGGGGGGGGAGFGSEKAPIKTTTRTSGVSAEREAQLDLEIEQLQNAKRERIGRQTNECIQNLMAQGMQREFSTMLCRDNPSLIIRSETQGGELELATKSKTHFADCIGVMVKKGFARTQARQICMGQAHKVIKRDLAKRKVRDKADVELAEKIDLSVPVNECINVYVREHGKTHEEAVSICNSAEAKAARAKADTDGDTGRSEHDAKPLSQCVKDRIADGASRKEAVDGCMSNDAVKARLKAGYEAADYDAILDALISDEDIQVVVKAEEEILLKADEVSLEEELEALWAEIDKLSGTSEEEFDTSEEDGEGLDERESEVSIDGDVNELAEGDSVGDEAETEVDAEPMTEETKSDSESDELQYDELVNQFKSALLDESLDRGEKVVLTNHYLEQLAEIAGEQIHNDTEASPDDVAGMLKAALDETVVPYAQQVAVLVERVNELEEELRVKAQGGQVHTPSSKQLQYTNQTTLEEKAEAEEKSGALSSRDIVDKTVFYAENGNPVY